MPAVLTHKSIMLLARERLAELHSLVEAKIATRTNITDLERALGPLAKAAYDMMSTLPFPDTDLPGQLFARPVGERVSKFAVMGSMGPDITGFSALLSPGQAWVFDMIHKAYPDGNREAVDAQTCDLAFEIWREVSAAINARTDNTDKDKHLKNMRAYLLGHLCHLAGDIVSHPFIADLEWHAEHSGQDKLSHADGEASHDARAAKLVLLRGSTRDGQDWDGWWPTLEEVPPEFFTAYENALETIYSARTNRRRGFGEFEERFSNLDPLSMSADFIRDGYSTYRSAILSIAYDFGAPRWFFAGLSPLFFWALLFPILAAALPHAKLELTQEPPPADEPDAGERKVFELLALPMTFGALASGIYGIWVATLTRKGVGVRTGFGIASAVIDFILGIVALSTSGTKPMAGWARWLFLFGIPAATVFAFLVTAIVDFARDGRGRQAGLALVYSLPTLILLALGVICWVVYRVAQEAESDRGIDTPAFWITYLIWIALLLVPWIVLAFVLRDIRIPEKAADFPAVKKHHVRLFDDTTLFIDPRATADGVPDLFYPSDRRPLLKLWWEGTGDLFIRPERFQLVFSFADEVNAQSQFVPAPVGPMKVSEYLHFLENTVKEPGGATGKLRAAVAFDDSDYELPSGAVFSDHGDEEEDASLTDHLVEAAKFRELGKTQDDAYLLYHARKREQAVRFGRLGPIGKPFPTEPIPADAEPGTDFEDLLRQSEDTTGYDYVHDALAGGETETLMSYAGDLGALLCLGAATHIAAAPPPENERIYQVFRNWSLDRRRVNEWRMLVAGNAFSDKAAEPERYDGAMLDRFGPADKAAWHPRLFDAGIDILKQGEAAALKMGWVPLFRAWMDIIRRPALNPLDPAPFRPENPTNLAISRGMAYLLDRTDPVPAP